MSAARAGATPALGQLLERYRPTAERAARAMVGSPELARELAQEALVQAYLCLGQLRDEAQFGAWLRGIVRNVCRGYLRQRGAELLSLDAPEGGATAEGAARELALLDPARLLEQRELARTLRDAVDALPLGEGRPAALFYFEQLSLREIAAVMGVSVASVKVRLHKARLRLRERLASMSPATTAPAQRRRGKMVQVRIADVLQKEETSMCAVVLLDEAGQRALPVWVGAPEAMAIAIGLTGFKVARPMTAMFAASLVEALGGDLERVCIQDVKEDTFYAIVRLRQGERVVELDARPSDALALAQRTGRPVYVREAIMDRFAVQASTRIPTLVCEGEEPLSAATDEVRRRLGEDAVSLVEAFSVD